MKQQIEMWAIQHVPSGFWDSGQSTLMLYSFEHDARLACPNSAFVPIKVIVTAASSQRRRFSRTQ